MCFVQVPLLIFVLLFLQRTKIKRVMLVKKSLEQELVETLEKRQSMSAQEHQHLNAIFEELRDQSSNDAISVETIARMDSLKRHQAKKRRSSPMFARDGLLKMRQLPTSRTLTGDERKISPLLLSMRHIFEKYEADCYW